MNLVLIGYRGTGKSAVAQILARRLGRRVVGLDAEIARRAGCPIPELVARHGWPHFRDVEAEIVAAFAAQDGLVLDTGGGVIERPANVEALRRTGRVFWLTAPVATIVARIQGGTERPALTAGKSFTEEVAEVLTRRTPLYAAAAHCTIDTAGRTPEQVAEAILALWQA
jgi:shikimate kinase